MYSPESGDFTSQPPSPPYDERSALNSVPAALSSDKYNAEKPPRPIQLQPRPRVPWTTGLCDCFSDVRNCCVTCWCPCFTFGKVAEILDKGSPSCGASGAIYALLACLTPGFGCCYSCFYRSKLREHYSLPRESAVKDYFVHCCCELCALCQEYRELSNRGYEMEIGWLENVENRNHEMALAPVIELEMSRR